MRAARTPRTAVRYRPPGPARDSYRDHPISTPDFIRGERLGRVGPELRPIASAALRSLVLIAIAMLLILVLLPAALGAVGTQAVATS
jgi:hypothetical protein